MTFMAFDDPDQLIEVELSIGDVAIILNTIVIIMEITGDPDLFDIYEKIFNSVAEHGAIEEDDEDGS